MLQIVIDNRSDIPDHIDRLRYARFKVNIEVERRIVIKSSVCKTALEDPDATEIEMSDTVDMDSLTRTVDFMQKYDEDVINGAEWKIEKPLRSSIFANNKVLPMKQAIILFVILFLTELY